MPIKITFVAALLSIVNIFWNVIHLDKPAKFFIPDSIDSSVTSPAFSSMNKRLYKQDFASHQSSKEVHSATAIELTDNNIMAFWYGGVREGHKDVSIYKNTWDSRKHQWGLESVLITREQTKEGTLRYIRKLGNPVVTRMADNSIWLFYVSVSIGGWAGSSINLVTSIDEGQSWSKSKRLITSPFLNISTLVKGAAIHYQDGSLGLPVYHEFLGKFGELLRINSAGKVINKTRLSWGKSSLQPVVIPTSAVNAIAMMRYQGDAPKRILIQYSDDAALNWTTTTKTKLKNPNSAISARLLNNNKQILLAFNNHENTRENITLAVLDVISSDNNVFKKNILGKEWEIVKVVENMPLENEDKSKQFAYPWLLQTKNGNIHLLYTWHKNHIKHLVFNSSWLMGQSDKGLTIK
jgi:predicted neuraminidase